MRDKIDMKYFTVITLVFCALPISAIAQELPPAAILVGQPYAYADMIDFDKTIPIKNFECLYYGQNWQRQLTCEVYKADFYFNTSPYFNLFPENAPVKLCFKEVTRVSYPRQYKADESYSVRYDKGYAHIISDAPDASLGVSKSAHKDGFPSGDMPATHRAAIAAKGPKHASTEIYISNCDNVGEDNRYN